MNDRRTSSNNIAKWLPVGAAGGLLALVVGAGALSSGGDDAPSGSLEPSAGAVETFQTEPITTESYLAFDEDEDPAVSIAKVPIGQSLAKGASGDEVLMVQERLAELAFDPGPVDGQFGSLTIQAVWAFEKLILGTPRTEATGVVTPALWDRMQDPIQVRPRRPTGGLADHTEIYLPLQVMVVFNADVPKLVAHIATGELAEQAAAFSPFTNAAEYCETITIDSENGILLDEPVEKAICGRSYTPPGVFTAYRKIEGVRNGPLGGMFDPIYINQGIAIHGAFNVPLQPVSHGCIRVNRYIGSNLQTILELEDRVLIWDGVREPEDVSDEDRKMRWDYRDPNATTTTTTTTTTTVAPTTVPTTPAPTSPPTTVATPTTVRSTTTSSTTTTTVRPTTTSSTTSTTVEPVDDL